MVLYYDKKYGYINYCKNHGSLVAGQAYTKYECNGCEEMNMWHNTAKPVLCASCAEELHSCQFCGRKHPRSGEVVGGVRVV